MKFTQGDAYKKIVSSLTRGGKDLQVSERSINELLDSLMATLVNDETELDDFVSKTKSMFETINANAKKDYSDFVNKWKTEHPEPSTTPAQNANQNSEFDSALERIKKLEEQLQSYENTAAVEKKRGDVISKLKGKGVKDENWLQNFLSEVDLSKIDNIDEKVEKWTQLYNTNRASTNGNLPPVNTTGTNVENQYMASIKAAATLSKNARASLTNE